jgi:hypothetical protein
MPADVCVGPLIPGADNSIELRDLIDKTNGDAAVTTATVTLEVFRDEDTGVDIPGVTLPLSMPATGVGSNTYRGNIPDTATLTDGQRVELEVRADDGANRRRPFRKTAIVKE